MTDASKAAGPGWLDRLREVIRGSTHETRNSLNGLVVNLEVVRSRVERAGADPTILPFAEQAAAQAEETVKLSEAGGALMALIAGSLSDDGTLHCSLSPDGSELQFTIDKPTGERVLPGLQTLGAAAGFRADTRDGTVILSFPRNGSIESEDHE